VSAAATFPYEVLGQNAVTESWDGSPMVLGQNQSALMPQTPNGTVIFSYINEATQNNSGSLGVTSGGAPPSFLTAPANALQPSMWVNNWQANSLNVTNVSANSNTPIKIQAIGRGMPGTTPLALTVGTTLAVGPGATAQGATSAQWMQLVMASIDSSLGVIAVIGGPVDASGNNGYVFGINAAANTGPGGSPPPAGYYATTTSNSYTFQFNWGATFLFAANMSALNSSGFNLTLRAL
jgi:hypothetical protein